MDLTFLLYFSTIAYSATFGYLESPAFKWARDRARRVHPVYAECYHCCGFWISLVVASFFPDLGWGQIIGLAFFGSGVIVVLDKLITCLCELINRVRVKDEDQGQG